MTDGKYPLPMRAIHWLMAIILIGLIAVGIYMEGMEKSPQKWEIYALHKSMGVIAMGLILLRILIRVVYRSKIPPLPQTLPRRDVLLAKAVHILLYVTMFLLPLSGYIMSDAGGHAVKLFGMEMPNLIPDGEYKEIGGFFHSIHGPLGFALAGLIVLHIAGAIKHRFFDKPENDVIRRML